MVEITPKKLRDILLVQDMTERLLQELADIGFDSKAVVKYRFTENDGGARWRGLPGADEGETPLHRDGTASAVAHELGHGFHERLQHDRDLPDRFGEDDAEAMRWFVEE